MDVLVEKESRHRHQGERNQYSAPKRFPRSSVAQHRADQLQDQHPAPEQSKKKQRDMQTLIDSRRNIRGEPRRSAGVCSKPELSPAHVDVRHLEFSFRR